MPQILLNDPARLDTVTLAYAPPAQSGYSADATRAPGTVRGGAQDASGALLAAFGATTVTVS